MSLGRPVQIARSLDSFRPRRRHRLRGAIRYCAVLAALLPAPVAGQDSAAAVLPAVAPPTEAAWLDQIVEPWFREAARRTRGEWGIAIADQNGRLLWARNPDTPLIPASTVKVFTTGFARSVLG
ncbi:MAG: D-alanyl-D-alanine carboxypeptidase, partial [Gemmatimonadales bacterium]